MDGLGVLPGPSHSKAYVLPSSPLGSTGLPHILIFRGARWQQLLSFLQFQNHLSQRFGMAHFGKEVFSQHIWLNDGAQNTYFLDRL